MSKAKKCLMTLLLFALAVSAFCSATVLSHAASLDYDFDGKVNYAAEHKYWADDFFADKTEFTKDGFVYKEWGAASNAPGNAMKSLLPKDNTVTIDFNLKLTTSIYNVVFADASKTPDSRAIRPWEIAGGSEHAKLEIQSAGIFLWKWNEGNKYVSGNVKQLTLTNPVVNYADGNDHTLVIDTTPIATGINVIIKIDGTEHFNGKIETASFVDMNPVLTLGIEGVQAEGETAQLKSVKITSDAGEAPEAPAAPSGIFLNAADHTVNKDVTNEVVIDAKNGSLTVGGYATGNYGATYHNVLPKEYDITFDLLLDNSNGNPSNMEAGIRIVLLDTTMNKDGAMVGFDGKANPPEVNGDQVVFQIDANNNIWIRHIHGGNVDKPKVVGIANSGLGSGTVNSVRLNCFVDYESECITYGIYVNGAKKGGIDVEDLNLIGNYYLTFGGSNNPQAPDDKYPAKWIVSHCEIADTSASGEINLAKTDNKNFVIAPTGTEEPSYANNAADGTYVGADGPAFLATDAIIDKTQPFGFDFQKSSEWGGNYVFLNISNFTGTTGWGPDAENGVTTGDKATIWWEDFSTMKYVDENNKDGKWVANPGAQGLTNDKANHSFRFVPKTVSDTAYILDLYIDGELKATIDLSATKFVKTPYIALSFRQTGGNGHTTISNFTATTANGLKLAELTQEVYKLDLNLNGDNYKAQKDLYTAVKGKIDALEDKTVVRNLMYLDLFEENLAVYEKAAADQEAAAAVEKQIAEIAGKTVTADNVADLKAKADAAQKAFDALTKEQKELVTNKDKIAEVKAAIKAYEDSVQPEQPDTPVTPEKPDDKEEEKKGGCGSSMTVSVIGASVALLAAAVAVLAVSKKRS